MNSLATELSTIRRSMKKRGASEAQIQAAVHAAAKRWLTIAESQRLNPAVKTRSMAPGEYRSQVSLERQQFSLNGLGCGPCLADWVPYRAGSPEPTDGTQGTWLSPSQVPKADRESAARLISQHQSFGGLGQVVPVESLIAGEYQRQLRLQKQEFNLQGLSGAYEAKRRIPPKAFRRGELGPLRTRGQQFDLRGLGTCEASRDVPVSALRAGEYGPLRTRGQRFDLRGLGTYEANRDVPVSAFRPGEYGPLRTRGQQFDLRGLGTYEAKRRIPPKAFRRGELGPLRTRGQQFDLRGLGTYEANRDVPVSAFRPGEYGPLRTRGQRFDLRGLGDVSAQEAARLYALQQQAAAIAAAYSKPKTGVGGSRGAAAEIYVDPTQQIRTAYVEREIQLPEICDAQTGTCIRYAAPDPKVVGTAFTQGQMSLPGFYAHPTLGPWGVDPNQAYQYWATQQAALEAAPFMTPMSIFGSPGLVAQTPGELPGSSVARPDAYDPYNGAFPEAGTAVERF